MRTKRMYRRTSVKKVEMEALKDLAVSKGGVGTTVGLDIGKEEMVAVLRWENGSFEPPWSVKNPSEISDLVEILEMLAACCDSLTVGLESTGTYGEAIRCAMTDAGLEVHRISGKACSDYKEIFDGVPSQHDGKDAAIIAELTYFGKGTAWPFTSLSEEDQEIRHQVQRLDAFRCQATQWMGRLEGVLAKHWPGVTKLLSLNSSTLVQCIMHYGGPKRLVADPLAAQNLRKWGRAGLSAAKIEQIIESARRTHGVPAGEIEMEWMQEIATELHKAILEVKACQKRLESIARSHASMRELVDAVGPTTLCVIWATVGDPANYTSSGAFLKALGLNLKELSSGKRQGQLAITKRGPSLARRYLYFWAMRAVNRPELRGWYQKCQRVGNRRGSGRGSEHRKMKGLVAMMRKLCRSLWHTHKHQQPFDYGKVFPGHPLEKRRRRRRRVMA